MQGVVWMFWAGNRKLEDVMIFVWWDMAGILQHQSLDLYQTGKTQTWSHNNVFSHLNMTSVDEVKNEVLWLSRIKNQRIFQIERVSSILSCSLHHEIKYRHYLWSWCIKRSWGHLHLTLIRFLRTIRNGFNQKKQRKTFTCSMP